jgi:hypothetical protein
VKKQRRNTSATAVRGKRGRRTLCTAQTTKALCDDLAHACTIKTACEAQGISVTSFHEWVRRGEAGEEPFAQFAAAVRRARGRGKAALVRSILEHPDWRGKMELLARVYPDEYARTAERPAPVDTTDADGKQIGAAVYLNTPRGIEELIEFPSIQVKTDKLADPGGEDGELPGGDENVDQDEPAYEIRPGRTVRVDENETFG